MILLRPGALLAVPLLLVGGALLSGCGGSDASTEVAPSEALSRAKAHLDETPGVTLSLSTDELPSGLDGLLSAKGLGTHQPAFDGTIEVSINSLSVDAPVVSVDDTVFAKLPFTTKFTEINPADYGAPDPANLMDPDTGLSSWLTAVDGAKQGSQSRDGDRVLTTYSGTLPGSAVASVIPSASKGADFPATFRIDDDGYLTTAEVSGPFYGDQGIVDYTITLSDYGNNENVSRP